MLGGPLRSWAGLMRRLTRGRPNYVLAEIRMPRGWTLFVMLPLFAVRTVVEDGCWLAGGLRFFPALGKRMRVPRQLLQVWGYVTAIVPALLGFRSAFTLLHLRAEDVRVEVSIL